MSRRTLTSVAAAGLVLGVSLTAGAFLTTSNSGRILSYTGHLDRNGEGATGQYSMRFRLYTDSEPSVSTTCWVSPDLTVDVYNGSFTAPLGPVDASCFAESVPALSVGTEVRGPMDTGFVTLIGRQRIYAAAMAAAAPRASDFTLSGKIGIGTATPSAALDVRRAWGNQTDPSQGLLAAHNTTVATDAHASLLLRTTGAGGGNPFVSLDAQNEAGWSLGMDNADANKFKISNAWSSVTTNTRLTLDTAGALSVTGPITAGRATFDTIIYPSGWNGTNPGTLNPSVDGDENTATAEGVTAGAGNVGIFNYEASSTLRGIAFIKMGVRTTSPGSVPGRFRVRTGSDAATYATVWDSGDMALTTTERVLTVAVPFYGRALRVEAEDRGAGTAALRVYEVSVKRYE